MVYRFVRERGEYSALASGQVLYSAPGRTAFPVRLASEVFQRCTARLATHSVMPPYVLYDPCCGGGQLVTTLGFLHGEWLGEIVGSDVDAEAVRLAARNLALLTPGGLDRRIAELDALRERYGKESHAAALSAARSLHERLPALTETRPIAVRAFQADATRPDALARQVRPYSVSLVIVDVPYGRHSTWAEGDGPGDRAGAGDPDDPGDSPVGRLLGAMRPLIVPGGVVAIAAAKGEPVEHEHYRRLERLRVGRRQVALFTPRGAAERPPARAVRAAVR